MLSYKLESEAYHPRNFVEGDRLVSLVDFIDEIQGTHYVLVGEDHNSVVHMDFHRLILEGLHRRKPKVVLGMEHFLTKEQEVIDAYLQGNIDFEDLVGNGYFDSKSYELRKGILDSAKTRGVKVRGLATVAEETFGVPVERMSELSILEVLRGYRKHDDYMAEVVKGIDDQVLLLLGLWHTCKEEEGNLTKKLPSGSFITAHIDEINFDDPNMDKMVIAYSLQNPNKYSWDYKVVRVAR